jgi:signal transduction histidine kinase
MEEQERAVYSDYTNAAALLDEYMDVKDRLSLTRFISHTGSLGNIAVFRDDFLVLYSAIPEFTAGKAGSKEEIFALITGVNSPYAYSFESPGWLDGTVYLLIRRNQPTRTEQGGPPPPRMPMGRFFVPIVIIITLFLFPTVFAIIMSLVIARSITKSVMVLENATRRIAEGELDLAVDAKGSNEITSLTNSLNKMRNDLKEEELRRYRFIMGITHDLKTPLTLIKGYAEAIEDGIAEDTADSTGIIAAKADQLEGMINDLIDFVRMDTGEWRSQLKQVAIADFLQDTAKAMTADAELLRHQFLPDIALPENFAVPMDERMVLRALENLVNNAIRYTPDDSIIRLSASLKEDAVLLTISDNGPGIDKEDLPHIFEMFYRGSSSRREQGMGLGLAVVKWVVDSHGWSISVSSEPGKGTCFQIRMG